MRWCIVDQEEVGGGIDLLVSRPFAWDAEDLTTTEGAFALSVGGWSRAAWCCYLMELNQTLPGSLPNSLAAVALRYLHVMQWRALKEHTADGFGNGPRQATTLPAPRVGSHLMQLRQRDNGANSGGGSSGQTAGSGSRQDGSSGRGNIERVWSAQELDLGEYIQGSAVHLSIRSTIMLTVQLFARK
jgi:hypothetical protein